MSVSINANRTVPVQEDLTTDDLTLQVLRGLEIANRADLDLAVGVASLQKGEWAVLQADGSVDRAGATPSAGSFPVFAGTERYDVQATKKVTVLMGPKGLVMRSSVYDTAPTYAVNDALTVKDLGGGESKLTKAAGAEAVLARVVAVGTDYLDFITN